MSSRNEPEMPDRRGAELFGEHEALVARARVLIADPAYPTAAIVEELADMLLLHGATPELHN